MDEPDARYKVHDVGMAEILISFSGYALMLAAFAASIPLAFWTGVTVATAAVCARFVS